MASQPTKESAAGEPGLMAMQPDDEFNIGDWIFHKPTGTSRQFQVVDIVKGAFTTTLVVIEKDDTYRHKLTSSDCALLEPRKLDSLITW